MNRNSKDKNREEEWTRFKSNGVLYNGMEKFAQNSKSNQNTIYDSFGSLWLQVDVNSGNNILTMPNLTIRGSRTRDWLLQMATQSRTEYDEKQKAISLERAKFVGEMNTLSHIAMATWLRTCNVGLIQNYGNQIPIEIKPTKPISEEILHAYD